MKTVVAAYSRSREISRSKRIDQRLVNKQTYFRWLVSSGHKVVGMKRRLMEILACPIDKHYPLELHVFDEKEEITEGMLVCPECDRWYPIVDEIPQMLPDDLREAKEDLMWLQRWKERVPERVLTQGKPFKLS